MTSNLETTSNNLESEFLKGLRNQTTIGDIMAQVSYKSKILPYVRILEVNGDVVKMIGLTSNRPKQYNWNYKREEFGPDQAIVHKEEITEKDKLIFYTVFSEPIERLAVSPERSAFAIAEQSEQVSSDIADFYDEEFVQNYVCDRNRYHKDAIVELSIHDFNDIQKIGELLITTGYQMTSPSTLFNLKESRVNVSDTKQLLCFINYPLYAKMQVASTYKSPSPTLDVLERIFTVIPVNMKNNFGASLIDSRGIALGQSLNIRYLALDEHVAAHKLLDHIWRKWIFTNYRPAFAIVNDGKTPTITSSTTPKKDILADYAGLSDKSKTMNDTQAKEWNGFGFTYEQVQDWISTGLLVSDAKFANWMKSTKAKSDTKFKNYENPVWCLNNLGNSGHKSLKDLKTEAGNL